MRFPVSALPAVAEHALYACLMIYHVAWPSSLLLEVQASRKQYCINKYALSKPSVDEACEELRADSNVSRTRNHPCTSIKHMSLNWWNDFVESGIC